MKLSFAEKEVDDIKEHQRMLNKQVPVHLFIYLLLTQRYQSKWKFQWIVLNNYVIRSQ